MGFGLKTYLSLLCAVPKLLNAQSTSTTFDYVIVGGGTAGLVVAARLSEDPSTTVAVIEAGIHHVNEPLVDTPELFGQALDNPAFDWRFATIPQPGLNNNSIPQNRGKMLGGTSGLNFMAWDRASSVDYDAWEKLGATGWNFNSLLPYFKKSEAVSPPTATDQALFPGSTLVPEGTFDEFHGRSGPLQASYNVFYFNITKPYVQSVNALGISTNSDPYEGNGIGIYNTEMSIDRVHDVGKRSYSASTYFQSAVDRPNFTAFTATQATKINFVTHTPPFQAVSVDVVALDNTGFTGTITARKEIVLSAGTFQTPQLLELSGIGNKTILQTAGVDALIDLPGVGENLQDHTLIREDFEVESTLLTYDILRNNATFLAEAEAEYATNHTGIFASVQLALAFPALKSIVSPDVLSSIQAAASKLIDTPGLPALTKAQYELQASWLVSSNVSFSEYILYPGGGFTPVPPTPGSAYMTIFVAHMHPFARGTVHINSSEPLDPPLINPRYLDNDADVQIVLQSSRFARTIAQTGPVASLVVSDHVPPSNVSSDADWLEFVRTSTGTIWHPVGTAAMLPQKLGGVVDPETLKVYGTTNLRVVDASIFPSLIAAHPQSVIYAAAERASDIIKGVI